MEKRRREYDFEFPFRGVGRFFLDKDKPNGFTRDAENVVGQSPLTGQNQGGQRPGLSKFTDGAVVAGQRVQAGISVSHDRPAFTFRGLGAPLNDPNPNPLIEDWGLEGPQLDEAYDVRADASGNSYFVTSRGTIVKRNSAGDVVKTANLPVTNQLRAARRFAVAADGSILAGGNSVNGNNRAVLWRLRKDQDTDDLVLAFELELDAASVEAIEFVNEATARVAVNGASRVAEILTVFGVNGEDPTVQQRHVVPYPVGDLAIGERGIYVTCRPNPDRGAEPAGQGFSESQVDWTPYDLAQATTRIHFWASARYPGAAVDGARMVQWPDLRLSGEAGFLTPDDDTTRTLDLADYRLSNLDQGPDGPRWRAQLAGPHPGFEFEPTVAIPRQEAQYDYDNGTAFQTNTLNIDAFPARADKLTFEGKLPASRGLWPLTNTHYHSATVIVLRWKIGALPGAMWVGGAYPDYNMHPSLGFIAICVNDDGSGTAGQANGEITLRGNGVNGGTPLNFTIPSHGTTNLRMAVLVLNRKAGGLMDIRCNGQSVATGVAVDDSSWPNTNEFFGNRIFFEQTNNVSGFLDGVDSLHGSIHEMLTVFGESTIPAVHDQAIPTADLERLEAYAAWNWGCASDCLPPGHTYASAPPTGSGVSVSEADTQQALRSPYGILLKLDNSGEGAVWAIAGAGMGYGVEAGHDGGVFVVGPRSVPASYPSSGLLGPVSRARMRVIDRGATVDWPKPRTGRIRFTGTPVNGDYFTIHDGFQETTFEFQSSGTPSIPGAVALDPGSSDPHGHASVSVAGIVLSSAALDAIVEGISGTTAADVALWSKLEPDTTAYPITIHCPVSNAFRAVYGMDAPGEYPDGTWQGRVDEFKDPNYMWPRMAVDHEGDLYVPWSYPLKANHITKYYGASGFEVWTHPIGGTPSGHDVHAVAIDTNDDDLFPARGPEFAWVASSNLEQDGSPSRVQTQTKLRLVESTPRNGPDLQVSTVSVVGGSVFLLNEGAAGQELLTSAFEPSSTWIQTGTLHGEVFLVDNGRYYVVKLRRHQIEEWKPKTAGEMPEGGRLFVVYRNRAVLARTKKDPFGIYASAHGDAYDWDVTKALDTPTAAFAGIRERKNPDVVTALAPFYDERLVIGGASSIQVLRGDLSGEGSIDLFTSELGIAFGNSWALSPEGLLYFFADRGGVWVMHPAAEGRAHPPQEVTDFTVGRELNRIDLTRYRPRLVWDHVRDGLWLLFVYVGSEVVAPEDHPRHWWYDKKRNAWWPQRFHPDLGTVTAGWQQRGGSEDDRRINIGFDDGVVRFLDDSVPWDDGKRIDSYVILGPIHDGRTESEWRGIRLTVSREGGPVTWATHASDDPEVLGEPLDVGTVEPGFSGYIPVLGRGAALWLRLGGSNLQHSWAVGEIMVTMDRNAGDRRSREGVL